jgi:hypothetical protein
MRLYRVADISLLLITLTLCVHARIVQYWENLKTEIGEKVTSDHMTIQSLTELISIRMNLQVEISLEQGPNGYTVKISFERVCGNLDKTLSQYFKEPEEINLIRGNGIGPDEIIVQLEGNTLQSKVAKCTDFCKDYEATFQVLVTGRHILKVVRLRTEYTAVRYVNKYPRLQYDVILDEELGILHNNEFFNISFLFSLTRIKITIARQGINFLYSCPLLRKNSARRWILGI